MRERARGQRSRGWLIAPCERPIDPIENSIGITNFLSYGWVALMVDCEATMSCVMMSRTLRVPDERREAVR